MEKVAAARPPVQDEIYALCREAAGYRTEDDLNAAAALAQLENRLPDLDDESLSGVLTDPRYRALRDDLLRARALAWYDQECRLARRSLAAVREGDDLPGLFRDHIPRESYRDELNSLCSIAVRNVLIVGSGPCPMSAIVMQDAFPETRIVAVDRSAEACRLAAGILGAAGYGSVETFHADAGDLTELDSYDCILMALTVGASADEKRRIIGNIKAHGAPETILAARTAAGWGRVLYPSIDLPEFSNAAAGRPVISRHQRSVVVPLRLGDFST